MKNINELIEENKDVFIKLAKGPKPLLNISKEYINDIYLIYGTMKKAGYDCYLVGGCIRDMLLNREPKDYDFSTNATPEQVKEVFKDKFEVIPTGIEFGTVTVMCNGIGYEITTYRTDCYDKERGGNAHHPSWIEYANDIITDLSRRDFTINAMAYDFINDKIIDPYNGQEDLERKFIRCVGNPVIRFTEDPLRMLRAIRFQSQLDGFSIVTWTRNSIWDCRELIKHISGERIQMELNKILLANPIVLDRPYSIHLLQEIMPEFTSLRTIQQNNPWHSYNAYTHSIKATEIIEPELHLRLAMLFHDLGKYDTLTTDDNGIDHFYNHGIVSCDKAREILKRLRYSNEMIDKVCLLIKEHDRRIEPTKKAVKKILNIMGEEGTRDLLKIRWADICAQNPIHLKRRARKLFHLTDLVEEIIENKEPFSRKDLKINGKMLMEIGFEFGPSIGKALDILLGYVQENPELNNATQLKVIAHGILLSGEAE